jgi:hypothetical protein
MIDLVARTDGAVDGPCRRSGPQLDARMTRRAVFTSRTARNVAAQALPDSCRSLRNLLGRLI